MRKEVTDDELISYIFDFESTFLLRTCVSDACQFLRNAHSALVR